MKNIINTFLTIVLFSLFNYSDLKAQVYKSMIKGKNYVQITLREEKGTLIATKSNIQGEKGLGSRVYNLTELEFTENRLEIPGDGNYWWIPFEDGQEPVNLKPYSNWCYECLEFGGCHEPDHCEWKNVGANCQQCICGSGQSGECFVQRCECGTNRQIVGGGIIVSASRVIFD